MSDSNQLHPIEASAIQARRERVFLVLAGLFLGSLTMLNILGVSRFIVLFSIEPEQEFAWNWGTWASPNGWSFALAAGVLPYPVTFLCTDLISEFYGRARANWVVAVGLMLNVWVVAILWIAGELPAKPLMDKSGLPAIEVVEFAEGASSDDTSDKATESQSPTHQANVPYDYAFYKIRKLAFGAVLASMVAYLAAQLCDVYLFHFWKRVTQGKHLWLRNNGSTLISQLVDTVAVILITHFLTQGLPIEKGLPADQVWRLLFLFIATGYVFKLVIALLDTLPFYGLVYWMKGYLEFDPMDEHKND